MFGKCVSSYCGQYFPTDKPLSLLCSTQHRPNRDDCKWLWRTTNGRWTALNIWDVSALSLLRLFSHHRFITAWLVFTVRSRSEGSLSADNLKRQNTTPLWEVNHSCSSLLQTKGSWQTLKTTKYLSDANGWKLQRRLVCASVCYESWDVLPVPVWFIVFCNVVKIIYLMQMVFKCIISACGRCSKLEL